MCYIFCFQCHLHFTIVIVTYIKLYSNFQMNLLLPEQDFWWVESETTTQINRNMPKVCERRLFVPRRAKCYGAIKWTAAIMVQGLGAVKDLKRYEIKPH